jgi:hypothetical protein
MPLPVPAPAGEEGVRDLRSQKRFAARLHGHFASRQGCPLVPGARANVVHRRDAAVGTGLCAGVSQGAERGLRCDSAEILRGRLCAAADVCERGDLGSTRASRGLLSTVRARVYSRDTGRAVQLVSRTREPTMNDFTGDFARERKKDTKPRALAVRSRGPGGWGRGAVDACPALTLRESLSLPRCKDLEALFCLRHPEA